MLYRFVSSNVWFKAPGLPDSNQVLPKGFRKVLSKQDLKEMMTDIIDDDFIVENMIEITQLLNALSHIVHSFDSETDMVEITC